MWKSSWPPVWAKGRHPQAPASRTRHEREDPESGLQGRLAQADEEGEDRCLIKSRQTAAGVRGIPSLYSLPEAPHGAVDSHHRHQQGRGPRSASQTSPTICADTFSGRPRGDGIAPDRQSAALKHANKLCRANTSSDRDPTDRFKPTNNAETRSLHVTY